MKRILGILAVAGMASLAPAGNIEAVSIGEKADKLQFKDIRFLHRTLKDLGDHKGYALVFLNTKCPIAQRYLPRLEAMHKKYGPQGVQFVGVYPAQEDGIQDMASHALEGGVTFHVVKDEDQKVSQKLGVTKVPQVVLLDSDYKVVYRGRVDDQYRVGGPQPKVSRNDLAESIEELLAGKAMSVSETPVDGCKLTPWRTPEFDHPITFHENVSRILQKRCQSCHHDGEAVPFSLVTYEDVAAQSEMVAEVVNDGRMPPWYAHSKYGDFPDNPSMTQEEKDMVSAWVRGGMAKGDESKAPQPLVFEDREWRIGEPDLKVTMTQTHKIKADGYLPYSYVILPYVFLKDTYVEAIEILPHNKNVVHHCNMAYVNVGKGKAGRDTFITGYVPGGQPMILGHGVAYKIPAGSSLVLQIHYVTTGKEEESKISVGFKYATGTVKRITHFFVLDPRGFGITPGDPMFRLSEERAVQEDAILLGLFTHMHVRGRDMTFTAKYPDGKKQTLLQIPNFNFEWQLGYKCREGQVKLPKGTKIEAVAHYDNSTFNPYNPDPKRKVPYGDQTYDEMFNGFVFYIHENEVLDLKMGEKGTVAEEAKKVASN